MRLAFLLIAFFLAPTVQAVQLKAGLTYASFDYNEKLDSPKRSREVGWVPFLELGARWAPPSWDGHSLSLDWTSTYNATTLYEGTDLTTNEGITDHDQHSFHRFEGVFEYAASETMILYGGLSYDYWDRYLSYGTGYREIYQWWTVPVGLRFPLVFNRGSWWRLDFAVRPMISGVMRVIFSETVTGGDDADLTLGNEIGWRLRLPYQFYNDGWRFDIEPWYESYSFGASGYKYNSTPTGTGGAELGNIREPASTTVKMGLTLRYLFLF